MRQLALMTAAFAFAMAGPADAAWQSYENEPLGYSVMFPAEPSEGTGFYRSDLAPNAPTHYSSLQDGDSTFIAMVIDTGRVDRRQGSGRVKHPRASGFAPSRGLLRRDRL